MTFSIRQKIIFFTVIPVTLIYNIIFLVSLFQNMNSETHYIESRLTDAVAANAYQLNNHLRDAVLLAENASSLMETFSDFNSTERMSVSRALLSTNDILEGMGIAKKRANGRYQLGFAWRENRNWVQYPSGQMLSGLDNWLAPWLAGHAQEGWSPLLDLDGNGKDVGYIYASRYHTRDAEGAALVFLPIAAVKRQWIAPSGISPRLVLLNEKGQAIYYSHDLGFSQEQAQSPEVSNYIKKAVEAMDLSGKALVNSSFGQEDVLIFRQKLNSADWTLLGAVPQAEVIAAVRSRVVVQAAIMVLSLVGIFISAWFVAGLIVRPLRKLDQAMVRVSDGDLGTEIAVPGDDEAAHLARRFSTMTQQLVLREQKEWETRTTAFDHIVQALSGEFFYFSHDRTGEINYVSPSITKILGVPPEEFRAHYTRFYTSAPINERGKEVTRKVLEGESSGMYEVEMRDNDGSIHYVEIVKVPVFDHDGKVTAIEGMGRDVTQRVNDATRFRGLLESAPDAMVITDADGIITMVNARTEALLGFLRSSLIGRKVSCLFPEGESKRFPLLNVSPRERVKLRIRSGFELQARKRSGRTIPVEITLNPIETPDGVLTSIFMRDVSDRHAAEQALRSSEERYRRMIEALQQEYIFYTQRIDGSFMYMTDSVERILGYTPADFMANSMRYLHSEKERTVARKVREQIRLGKTHPSYELEVVKPDGSIAVIEVLDTPAFNDRGQVTVIEGLVRDRTKEKAAARALAEARDAAEAANEAKTLFLSNMSHELRTPLNGVLGYAQLLLGGDITQEQYNRLVAIQACGQHLLTLINDILDLTKVESGKVDVESKPVNLSVLVDTVEQILYQKAEKSGLTLDLIICSDVPALVLGDEIKIRQILINLIGNGIKYTKAGQVRLKVSVKKKMLRFAVEDTGIGIAPEQIEHIFDPFRQGDGGRKEGGTGLGLSISQRLAAAMGGNLTVSSHVGKGSRFVFSMPLHTVNEEDRASALIELHDGNDHLAPGQHVKVLVVDDSATNRDILVQMLERAGFNATAVAGGRRAVEVVEQEMWDLVLMDLRMPDMSGFRAMRMIHTRLKRSKLPVIAISAGVYPSLLDDIRHWGFTDFISKPFRNKELFRVIRRHLQLVWKKNFHWQQAVAAPDTTPNISPRLAARLVLAFSDAVDMGDVEAIRKVALEIQHDGDATLRGSQAWADKILACCDALELEELEQIIAQLKAIG